MADNVRGNLIYCDTAGSEFTKARKLYMVLVTATGASAVCLIKDKATGGNNTILDLRVATSGETGIFDFSKFPASFNNGFEVDTLTNCTVTLFMENQ